jgi:hypothetical protein
MVEQRQAHGHAVFLAGFDGVNPILAWEYVDIDLQVLSVKPDSVR